MVENGVGEGIQGGEGGIMLEWEWGQVGVDDGARKRCGNGKGEGWEMRKGRGWVRRWDLEYPWDLEWCWGRMELSLTWH
jgi:hypothetical protein